MALFEVPRPSVGIAGSDDVFPVHRIYCIGKNYAAHVREMGGNPQRSEPVYFLKPADSVVRSGATIPYPPRTSDLHHEIELVVAIGRGGSNIAAEDAASHIFGYAVGIDLTRRDLQAAAKDKGAPWDTAKSFENAAPISVIRPAAQTGHPDSGRIWLEVNDEVRQDGDIADMIWPVADAIADLSTFYTLAAGDLLFTGTPEGVGALQPGDRVAGGVSGIAEISLQISNR
ncbi:MAG: fumarylacetoacetate hydrolase family protein [Gammaproteobacteria bacterium]|nr:fumarylacetoacetate hydrolase family protein [Gammaproteobacteria bacterium]